MEGSNHFETPLRKEGSLYDALPVDEFQHALGDGIGSTNMDDFLRNIWTSEETHAMTAAMDGSNGCLATQISLPKQGSLCLPMTVSMKMVEAACNSFRPQQETSAASVPVSMGAGEEVTLEDFLVNAGIVRETPPCNPSPRSFQNNGGFPALGMLSPVRRPAQQGDWMGKPHKKALSQQPQRETEQIPKGSAMVEAAPSYSETPLSTGHDEGCSVDTSNLSPAQFGLIPQPRRKRCVEAPIEQMIQRRQRRMIKNRESAARSRARKQAYTVELEAEVYYLKEENMRLLRKQVLFLTQEVLGIFPSGKEPPYVSIQCSTSSASAEEALHT